MLGVDDLVMILLATTLANLVVEVGAEVVAEWLVNSPDSPMSVPQADPASQEVGYDFVTQASFQVQETTGQVAERLTLKANELNTMLGDSMAWSGQMISTLGSSLGLQ